MEKVHFFVPGIYKLKDIVNSLEKVLQALKNKGFPIT